MAPPMIDPATLEHLFVTIGLLPILRAKPTLWKYQLEEGAALPVTIRKRMARFLATEAFDEAHDMPEFDYDEVLGLVSGGQTPEQTAALFAAVPDRELATDLGVMADRVQTWANGIIPREESSGGLNPQMDPPDGIALADFRRVWQVACDPMSVLDDLADGSLSEDQVAALALLYPALHADMSQAVTDSVAAIAARRGKTWQPTGLKTSLIGVLRQQQVVDLQLAAASQAIYAGIEQEQLAAQQAPPAPRAASNAGSIEGTPGQDAAGG
jgi:hypothetical protein